MNLGRHTIGGFFLLSVAVASSAAELDYRGQLSSWLTLTDGDTRSQIGSRYGGEFSFATDLSPAWQLGAEAAFEAQGYALMHDHNDIDTDGDIDPYRLWLRVMTSQCEARVGLQKISFGSATLLRPLMWFDTLDPRDPLQLTDGVYGIRGRYTCLNNANIWIWGLYGNDALRGWEQIPTDDDDLEWGGRLQIPLGPGECGLSIHHRRADLTDTPLHGIVPGEDGFYEQRIGLDGKWDVGIGLWFEGSVTHQEVDTPIPPYQRLFTVGTDYTFGIGNGLHVLGEHMVADSAGDFLGSGTGGSFSAVSFQYPLGLFDSVSAFVYYDWRGDSWSPFLEWRRVYDHWQITLSAFQTPEGPKPEIKTSETGLAGDGIRLMAIFTH